MEEQEQDGADSSMRLLSYCSRHCVPRPGHAGVRLLHEGETHAQLPVCSADAAPPLQGCAQQYPLPPPAPLPPAPGGSARATPLDVGSWRRARRGGGGASTAAGFWIPGVPAQPPQQHHGALAAAADSAVAYEGVLEGLRSSRLASANKNGQEAELRRAADLLLAGAESDGVGPWSQQRPTKLRRLANGCGGGRADDGWRLVGGHAPADVVGRWCRLFWADDGTWYLGQVREYNDRSRLHRVFYEADEAHEWLNLVAEDHAHRLQLLPPPELRAAWPPPPPPPPGAEASPGAAADRASTSGTPVQANGGGGGGMAASPQRRQLALATGPRPRSSMLPPPAVQLLLLQQQQQQRHGPVSEAGEELCDGRWRVGKQAYVQPCPQLITAGATPHALGELPLSRCWTPPDWAVHRLQQCLQERAEALAKALAEAETPLPAVAAGLEVLLPDCSGHGSTALGPSAALTSLGWRAGPPTAHARPPAERVAACAASERARVAVGRSGLRDGWGLFAREPIEQDTLVAECRGELLPCAQADRREAAYRAQARRRRGGGSAAAVSGCASLRLPAAAAAVGCWSPNPCYFSHPATCPRQRMPSSLTWMERPCWTPQQPAASAASWCVPCREPVC